MQVIVMFEVGWKKGTGWRGEFCTLVDLTDVRSKK